MNVRRTRRLMWDAAKNQIRRQNTVNPQRVAAREVISLPEGTDLISPLGSKPTPCFSLAHIEGSPLRASRASARCSLCRRRSNTNVSEHDQTGGSIDGGQ